MEPESERRIREAVEVLEAAGATVEEVSLPHTDYGLATYYIVAPAEASANLARYDGVRFGYSVRGGDDYLANYLATRGQGLRRRGSNGGSCSARMRCRPATTRSTSRRSRSGRSSSATSTSFSRQASTRWSRRPRRRPPSASAKLDPVQMYLSDACTLPVNMAGLPGTSTVASRGPARRPADRSRLVGAGALQAGARLRSYHRRRGLAAPGAARPGAAYILPRRARWTESPSPEPAVATPSRRSTRNSLRDYDRGLSIPAAPAGSSDAIRRRRNVRWHEGPPRRRSAWSSAWYFGMLERRCVPRGDDRRRPVPA